MVQRTLKFVGVSLMVWGCITWQRVGYAVMIDSRMDGDLYLQILKNELQNTLEYYDLNPPNIIIQQSNDPKNTCRIVMEWLEE